MVWKTRRDRHHCCYPHCHSHCLWFHAYLATAVCRSAHHGYWYRSQGGDCTCELNVKCVPATKDTVGLRSRAFPHTYPRRTSDGMAIMGHFWYAMMMIGHDYRVNMYRYLPWVRRKLHRQGCRSHRVATTARLSVHPRASSSSRNLLLPRESTMAYEE